MTTKRIILMIGVISIVLGIIFCFSISNLTIGVAFIMVGIIVCIFTLDWSHIKTMKVERIILMIGVLIIVIGIIACIFISDWYFGRPILTETLVGILIGTPLGWLGAYVAFYTVENKDSDNT